MDAKTEKKEETVSMLSLKQFVYKGRVVAENVIFKANKSDVEKLEKNKEATGDIK